MKFYHIIGNRYFSAFIVYNGYVTNGGIFAICDEDSFISG